MEIDRNEQLDVIKSHFNIKNDTELANKLGVPRTTLGSWRHKNRFDIEKIYNSFQNIDPHWLITGEGYIYDNKEQKAIYKSIFVTEEETITSKLKEAIKPELIEIDKNLKLISEALALNLIEKEEQELRKDVS